MQNQFAVEPLQRSGFKLGGAAADPDAPECLAKKVTTPHGGFTTYWLRKATSGPEAGHLCNPHSPGFAPWSQGKFNTSRGEPMYKFVKVPLEAFTLYVQFLETGNVAHLRQADRSLV